MMFAVLWRLMPLASLPSRSEAQLKAGLLVLATALLGPLCACEQKQAAPPAPAEEKTVETRAFDPPEPVDLLSPEALPQESLELTTPQKFPDCHRIFEADGTPEAKFPLDDAEQRPLELAGCAPEAHRVIDDQARLIAYAVPGSGKGWDLRVLYFEPSGELRWHFTLDRSANAEHFSANFRGSFITPLLPRLICAGTLWEGGTQATCVDAETGHEQWAGMMKFWAGVAPRAAESGLNTATLGGLTRRYPYSGVEMRFKPFEERGGRASYYAIDAQRLFFASAKDKSPSLVAYELARFQPAWRLELPASPRPSWAHAFEDNGLVLFKLDEAIYAADAATGKLLWAARVGKDEPPVAAIKDRLYLLLRRETEPNLLFSIAARSGRVDWQAPVPTGTLELSAYEDTLILRSVRAVQKVGGLDD